MSIALLTLSLFGCDATTTAVSGTGDPEVVLEGIVVEREWLSCSRASDCVYADLDCCGCSSGGNSLALNADYEADFYDANPLECPEGAACATVYTCQTEPRCLLGQCRGL